MRIAVPVHFSEKNIGIVLTVLQPNGYVDHITDDLVANVLQSWADVDLAEYAAVENIRAGIAEFSKDFGKLLALAGRLTQVIESLSDVKHEGALVASLQFPAPLRHDHQTMTTRDELAKVVATLVSWGERGAAYQAAIKGKVGQPPNFLAHLVLRDLAAIFKWATGSEPTRVVKRPGGRHDDEAEEGEESGPFYNFAAAVWPIVFANGDSGLPAAMKRWAEVKKTERSPVIWNINARHPEWRLLTLSGLS